MRGSKLGFDYADWLHYKCYRTSLNSGRSYIDSPDWRKIKKATRNPNNRDDKCFQYAITSAPNYEQFLKIHKEYQKLAPS